MSKNIVIYKDVVIVCILIPLIILGVKQIKKIGFKNFKRLDKFKFITFVVSMLICLIDIPLQLFYII